MKIALILVLTCIALVQATSFCVRCDSSCNEKEKLCSDKIEEVSNCRPGRKCCLELKGTGNRRQRNTDNKKEDGSEKVEEKDTEDTGKEVDEGERKPRKIIVPSDSGDNAGRIVAPNWKQGQAVRPTNSVNALQNQCVETTEECKKKKGTCKEKKACKNKRRIPGICGDSSCVCCVKNPCLASANKKCDNYKGLCKKKCKSKEREIAEGCKLSKCKCCAKACIDKTCSDNGGTCKDKKECQAGGGSILKGKNFCKGSKCKCCIAGGVAETSTPDVAATSQPTSGPSPSTTTSSTTSTATTKSTTTAPSTTSAKTTTSSTTVSSTTASPKVQELQQQATTVANKISGYNTMSGSLNNVQGSINALANAPTSGRRKRYSEEFDYHKATLDLIKQITSATTDAIIDAINNRLGKTSSDLKGLLKKVQDGTLALDKALITAATNLFTAGKDAENTIVSVKVEMAKLLDGINSQINQLGGTTAAPPTSTTMTTTTVAIPPQTPPQSFFKMN